MNARPAYLVGAGAKARKRCKRFSESRNGVRERQIRAERGSDAFDARMWIKLPKKKVAKKWKWHRKIGSRGGERAVRRRRGTRKKGEEEEEEERRVEMCQRCSAS